MLIPSPNSIGRPLKASLSRRVNANSQLTRADNRVDIKLIKKGEC